jgi:diguanylate cyclase (GGDEF)-like protein
MGPSISDLPQPPEPAVPQAVIERRLMEFSLERVGRVSLIIGAAYLPVALSHFVLLPSAGRVPMFAIAMSAAVALLLVSRWTKANPDRVEEVGKLGSILYACVIVHSLARLGYANGPGDTVFMGVIAVAMGLLPGTLFAHVAWLFVYLGGWSAILIQGGGASALRPFIAPLVVTYGVSIVVRYLEIRGDRRLLALQLVDTERKRELVRKAHHDALTGLPNRHLFVERLTRAFDAARGTDDPFAMLHLDIDRFKLVNESLGHQVGDKLLVAVAQRLLRFVRPGDIVARFASDEFAVLLSDLRQPDDALTVADRVRTVLAEPFTLDDYDVQLDTSVGIAMYRPEYATVGEMLRDADIAVGAAKKDPDGQRIFDGDMHTQAMERLEVEVDLRRGLKRDELALHYQPIVMSSSGRLVGFEALVRWKHPVRGLLYPAKFLSVAAESGLTVPLGRWVLERACRDLATLQADWEGEEPLHVSVNMAAQQFLHADAEQHLLDCMLEHAVPPEQLWIEITETTVLDRPEEAEARIDRLNDLGVKVCVDDFGVGYSSLGYLQRLNFSVLKLDRAFVTQEARSETIVGAVAALARGLGMTVVAEGVETEAQCELVTRLGCLLAQGYLFSRAVPLSEACELVRKSHLRAIRVATPTQRGSKAST